MGRRAQAGVATAGGGVRLSDVPPFDWAATLDHLAFRETPGVEAVVDGAYVRTTGVGVLRVTHEGNALRAEFWGEVPHDAGARLRSAFDLDADLPLIGAHLSTDPFLAPLVEARPALRVPGGWDPLETALRAVLGQQVAVKARHDRQFSLGKGRAQGEPFRSYSTNSLTRFSSIS